MASLLAKLQASSFDLRWVKKFCRLCHKLTQGLLQFQHLARLSKTMGHGDEDT